MLFADSARVGFLFGHLHFGFGDVEDPARGGRENVIPALGSGFAAVGVVAVLSVPFGLVVKAGADLQ